MTTNVINKGWFNPISFSVLLVLIFVSVVLYAMEIVNTQVFLLLIILPDCWLLQSVLPISGSGR